MKNVKYILSFLGFIGFGFATAQITPTSSKNYVIVQSARVATTNENDLNDYTKATTGIQYSDGFGRAMQNINYRASPNGKDLISKANTLDNFGRPQKGYLVAPISYQTTGEFAPNPEAQAQSFYGDNYPYQETQYNATYTRSISAGNAIHGAGKYAENKAVITGAGMRRYVVMSDQFNATAASFTNNILFKNIIVDENGSQIIEYTDQDGRKIQQDQINAQNGQVLSTAYVYDDIGRLRYIVPPKAFNNGTNFDETSTYFNEGIYAFHYDGRGRIVETHKPSGGWSYTIYNELDQAVMSQNARQRQSNLWEWVRFDGHGRKVMSGTYTNAIDRTTLQSYFDNFQNDNQFEERGYDLYGYTSRSYPISISANDVKKVYYYDDYNWVNDGNYNFQYYQTDKYTNVRGLETGSLVRKLDDNSFLKTVTYYDDKNRPIQSVTQNRFGSINQTDYVYNFASQILEERGIYRKPSKVDIILKTTYTYDHVGRKKGAIHYLNGKPTPLSNYKYDEAGRLIQKRLMQTGDDIIIENTPVANGKQDIANRYVLLNQGTITAQNGTFLACISPNVLQVIDYTYNIQGQLRTLNAHADGGVSGVPPSLFNLTLDYFETGQYYNGNLAKQTWQNPTGTRAFNYNYDGFDRLQSANYSGIGGENYTLNSVSYDDNSNITNLQRNGYNGGGWGQIDYLQYTYLNSSVGNRLQGVQDYTGNSKGFQDNGSNNDYSYWDDGSLKTDANKNITNISYNYMGLPDIVSFGYSGTQYIQNIYNADGIKLRQNLVNNGTTISTDFMGELIYRNDSLKTILHSEGRIYLSNSNISTPRYQFFIADHLGNTRLIVERQSATTAVFQTTDYGAWGEILENITGATAGDWKFLFQSNEYIDFGGYNTYDFHERQYDPYRGQFGGIDPIDNYSIGGTVAMNNNPLKYTDRDGKDPILIAIAIGAAIGALTNTVSQVIQNQGFNNWNWGSFAISTGIGAVTGAVGYGLGSVTAGWGSVGSGLATGAGTGFIGGGLGSLASGGNFWSGAWKGALWGGVLGGISGFVFRGKPYKDIAGDDDIKDLTGWEVEANTETANGFSEKYFSGMRDKYGIDFEVASPTNLPKGFSFNSKYQLMVDGKGNLVNGVQEPALFGRGKVWLAPARFTNDRLLFRTMGHELIHAWHDNITPFYRKGGEYLNITEASAHNWSLGMGVKLGYDDFNSSYQMFSSYISKLSTNALRQYYNIYHWSNNSGFLKYLFQKY
jgi:Domain of unknown function (DUF6443)